MKKIKAQINHIEIIYYQALHSHKAKKEEVLRHLLQLSFHLIDDVWDELETHLTKEEKKHGPKRTGGNLQVNRDKQKYLGGEGTSTKNPKALKVSEVKIKQISKKIRA
jgi:hypothetical protein